MLDFPLAGTYKYGVNFMIAGIYAMENIIRYIIYSFSDNASLRRRFLGQYTIYLLLTGTLKKRNEFLHHVRDFIRSLDILS